MRGPTVRFLGGVREIGGNKILIEDGPDRVLFDFGPSFSPRVEEYYRDYLQPRSASKAKDLLEFDLLPRIPGLYSQEALADSDLAYTEPEVHAIFVSHAHADHAGYLDPRRPRDPGLRGRGDPGPVDGDRDVDPDEVRHAPLEGVRRPDADPGRPDRGGPVPRRPLDPVRLRVPRADERRDARLLRRLPPSRSARGRHARLLRRGPTGGASIPSSSRERGLAPTRDATSPRREYGEASTVSSGQSPSSRSRARTPGTSTV